MYQIKYRSLRALLLTLVLSLSSNQARTQGHHHLSDAEVTPQNWRNYYYPQGGPAYKLKNISVVQVADQQVIQAEGYRDQAQQSFNTLNSQVQSIESAVTHHVNTKKQLKAQKNALETTQEILQNKLPQLESNVDRAEKIVADKKSQVTTAKQAKQAAIADRNQLKNAKIPNKEQLVATIMANLAKVEAECQGQEQTPACRRKQARIKKNLLAQQDNLAGLKQELKILESQLGANGGLTKAVKTAENQLESAQDTWATHQQNLSNTKQEMAVIPEKKQALTQKIKSNQDKINHLEGQLSVLIPQKNSALKSLQAAQALVGKASNDLYDTKMFVIKRILSANNGMFKNLPLFGGSHHGGNKPIINLPSIASNFLGKVSGFEKGRDDGKEDGRLWAELAAFDDAYAEGLIEGEKLGRDRDYREGLAQGKIEGGAEGRRVGNERGEKDGVVEGTQQAGSYHGEVVASQESGNRTTHSEYIRATNEGTVEGEQRAIDQGEREGLPLGEDSGIKKNENRALDQVELNGSFAGTFNYNVTPFWQVKQRGYERPYYAPQVMPPPYQLQSHLSIAFTDGYKFAYGEYLERTYDLTAANQFQTQYEMGVNEAFALAYLQCDPNHPVPYQRKCQQTGFNDGYGQAYAPAETLAYNEAFSYYSGETLRQLDEAFQNGQLPYSAQAANYQSAYSSTLYQKRKQLVENRVFQERLPFERESFKQLREEQIDFLYANFPVLKYEVDSLSLIDTGVNGVGVKDGIFQPGESVTISLKISNYSKVDATDVKLQVDGIGLVRLPVAIPAESTAMIVGAAQGVVPDDRLGRQISLSVEVFSSLTALEDKHIQARHFKSLHRQLLAAVETARFSVQYPVVLGALNLTNEQVVVAKENGLSLSLSNISQAANIEGPLKLEIVTDAKSQIITEEFETLPGVGKVAHVKGAKLNVLDDIDALTNVNLNAVLRKNGVIIGKTTNTLSIIPRIEYQAKADKPLLVFSSKRALDDVKEIIFRLGGANEVSVVDLDLNPALQNIVLDKGFADKTIIAVNVADSSAALSEKMEGLLKNSDDIFVAFVDARKVGLGFMRENPMLNNAGHFRANLDGFNSMRLYSLDDLSDKPVATGDVVLAQFDLHELTDALNMGELFTQDSKELAKALSEMPLSAYDDRDPELVSLMKVHNAMTLLDISKLAEAGMKGDTDLRVKYAKRLENSEKTAARDFYTLLDKAKKNDKGKLMALLGMTSGRNSFVSVLDDGPVYEDTLGSSYNDKYKKYLRDLQDDHYKERVEKKLGKKFFGQGLGEEMIEKALKYYEEFLPY